MRLGVVIEETWDFFREIYADFRSHFETSLFRRRHLTSGPFHTRINKALLDRDLHSFLGSNQVVFFEWASELLMVASRMPKRCAVVTRLHRYELYQWADLVQWDTVDRVILVSKAKQAEFCTRYPAHATKTMVVSPSIALDKFTYRPRQFAGDIGILCHLTPRKRVYDLILTFADLLLQDPHLHLHIAGGPAAAYRDYHQALYYVVRQLRLEDKVTFYGHVAEPWKWYPEIDIFLSNSYSEGLQVAPMEAMACGCYTLSHHWEGAEELLPEQNLFFTNQQLQEKLLSYCALPASSKLELSNAMYCWANERFDVRATSQQICQAVNEAAVLWAQAKKTS